MRKVLRATRSTITAEDIKTLEKRLDLRLPDSYAEFLLTHNGGLSKSSDPRFNDAVFYAIIDNTMSLYNEIYESREARRIPIAADSNEDPIFLDLDSTAVTLDDEQVAESFTGFVEEFLDTQ